MKVDGYMVTVEFDGSAVTLHPTNRMSRVALGGNDSPDSGDGDDAAVEPGDVRLPIASIASFSVEKASSMVNGTLSLLAQSGQVYDVHFRRKHSDGITALASALRDASLDETPRPAEISTGNKRLFSQIRGLKVQGGSIHYKGEGGAIEGCRAGVEAAGDIDRRITATRLILTGPFALGLRKKKDKRELYLVVEGSGFGFVAQVDPGAGKVARQVAARINAIAGTSGLPTAPDTPTAATPFSTDELAGLAELHRSGALTDEEFAAAKAKMLGL